VSKFREALAGISWKFLLVALPITSFPLLSRLFGGTMVAPLSFLPMVLLILIVVLPEIIKKKSLPKQFQPLYVFFLIAILSIALAYLRELPSFRAIPIWRNAVEGLVTLFFGFGFYLATIYCLKDQAQIRKALHWINLGGVVIILVAVAQYLAYQITDGFPEVLNIVQGIVSASARLYNGRATGLAFEPSWLAHQLNILYIPIWLGFTARNESVYRKRLFGKIPFEALLLGGGIISVFLSFSRIGWLTIIAVSMYLFFRLANSTINRLLDRGGIETVKKRKIWRQIFFKLILWLLLFSILMLVIFAAGLIMQRLDPRMEQLFEVRVIKNFGIMGWAGRLGFAERIIFWQSALKVFGDYPWFGSGLGVAGYYFPETTPSFGYRLPEILSVLLYDSFIPNAKNLWVRLLAETGIIGFSVFIAWVVEHWRNAKTVEKRKQSGLFRAMGLAGQLLILALIVEGFSLDTFGLPYFWIGCGLIVASWRAKSEHSVSRLTRKSA